MPIYYICIVAFKILRIFLTSHKILIMNSNASIIILRFCFVVGNEMDRSHEVHTVHNLGGIKKKKKKLEGKKEEEARGKQVKGHAKHCGHSNIS